MVKKSLRFVHITKSAGTSIEEVSNNQWGRFDIEFRDAVSDIFCPDASFWHIPLMFVKPEYVLKDLLKKYDYFCVVRNPFDRVISEYFCKWGGPKIKAKNKNDFNKWINNKLRTLQKEVNELEIALRTGSGDSSGVVLQGHWIPQYLHVIDMKDSPNDTGTGTESSNRICRKENILRFENNLAEDFDKLVKKYRLPSTITLKKESPSKSTNATNSGSGSASKEVANLKTSSELELEVGVEVEVERFTQAQMVHKLNNDAIKTFHSQDLSQENIDLIRNIYARDFVEFGYSTDVPPRPLPKPKTKSVAAPNATPQLDFRQTGDNNSSDGIVDIVNGSESGQVSGGSGRKRGREDDHESGNRGPSTLKKISNTNTNANINIKNNNNNNFAAAKATASMSMSELMAQMKSKKK